MKKLRETLVAVQQLDKNMSSLRSWLAHIETELSRPLVYDTCDAQEIQRKLNQQQVGGTRVTPEEKHTPQYAGLGAVGQWDSTHTRTLSQGTVLI